MLPTAAEIVVVPAATAVANPPVLIVATPLEVEAQVEVVVTLLVVPSE
jgi:hypothetical protein